MHIAGVPDVSDVTPYNLKTGEWVIQTTNGTLLDIFDKNSVDVKRTISNDMWDIYNTLGIEAVRIFIINEFFDLISDNGDTVDPRHIKLLVDQMTFDGSIKAASRNGIGREVGPLAKASFEEPLDNFIKAAAMSEVDNITGVSAAVMVGALGKFGSGLTKVMLDVDMMINSRGPPPSEFPPSAFPPSEFPPSAFPPQHFLPQHFLHRLIPHPQHFLPQHFLPQHFLHRLIPRPQHFLPQHFLHRLIHHPQHFLYTPFHHRHFLHRLIPRPQHFLHRLIPRPQHFHHRHFLHRLIPRPQHFLPQRFLHRLIHHPQHFLHRLIPHPQHFRFLSKGMEYISYPMLREMSQVVPIL